MKNLLSLTLASIILVACGESSNDTANNSPNSSTTGNICSKTLTKSINSTLSNVSNFKMFDLDETLCTARFQQGEKHYTVDLDIIENGTANELKGTGSYTNYDLLEKKIGFSKENEDIAGVGKKATYYKLRGEYKLIALSGNNAIEISAYDSWDKPIYKKEMAIDIAKSVFTELGK